MVGADSAATFQLMPSAGDASVVGHPETDTAGGHDPRVVIIGQMVPPVPRFWGPGMGA
jgi:hypothetical protein